MPVKTRSLAAIALAACLAIVLAACMPPVGGAGQGSLAIAIGDSVSRSLSPSLSMTPASYAISGSGPGGATFALTATSGSAAVQSLAFGSWTVQVEARNASGLAIGSGSGSAVVHSNQTTAVSITVRPYDGFGSLGLALRWNAGDIETAQVQASLLSSAGTLRALPFAISGASASFSASDVATGYHTLTLKLLDNGSLAMGAVEVVRVVKDQSTNGDFYFDKVNKATGTISVNVGADMSDPLTVSILGAAATKPQNRSLALTGAIAESGLSATYVWYVNGASKATGSSFTIDPSWAQGYYRIDLTAFSADGKRAGSATTNLQVVEATSLCSVSGTVRQNGSGFAGVGVSLSGTNFSALTDASGAWTIAGISPGSYSIATAKTGMAIVPDGYSRALTLVDADVTGRDFSAFALAPTYIAAIQGAGHLSPFNNKPVTNVLGVVTLVDAKQFWIQSLDPDDNPATSEGLLIFQNAATTVQVGDWVSINGTITEYVPQGAAAGGLSVTELKSPVITVLSKGHPLPAAVVVGTGGRIPPNKVYCSDPVGGVVDTSPFNPDSDAIDFWESLEFMRVALNNAQATGPTVYYASSLYSETPLIGDYGANATGLTARGGIGVSADDFNPEIVLVNDKFKPGPSYKTGDRFPGTITGVLDYSYGSFKIYASEGLPTVSPSVLPKETTSLVADSSKLTVASYNTENLSIASPAGDIDKCAACVVDSLKSPDIVVLCEVQDNNGPAVGGVDASTTWNAIIAAISAHGGPAYQYRQIDPVNNMDGGATDGNIRQGFLFNPSRVQFIDRAGGTSTAATTVSSDGSQAVISFSPGRIDPANAAWSTSRKPLIGEFSFLGQKVYVIGNHFNSKGGDTPLFGRFQPANLVSEVQRMKQAAVLGTFVNQILAIEPMARIVLAGDFNDFEFSNPITALLGSSLVDLDASLPKADRYTYVYLGNSQVLDHIIVSPGLAAMAPEMDIVHINAEYPDADRSSDHDPEVARFSF